MRLLALCLTLVAGLGLVASETPVSDVGLSPETTDVWVDFFPVPKGEIQVNSFITESLKTAVRNHKQNIHMRGGISGPLLSISHTIIAGNPVVLSIIMCRETSPAPKPDDPAGILLTA